MKRSEYKWNLFKMTWLVPNYARARGPAWWAWNAMDWWRRETDTHNYCSKISKIRRWWKEKAVKWLTPWLSNAREFMEFCVDCTDTKLLDYNARYFYIRTRDGNQCYFEGRTGLLGKVTIWKTQWMNDKGEAENLFMWSVINGLCGKKPVEEIKVPVRKSEIIWSGRVLTARQEAAAENAVTQHLVFCWSWLDIFRRRMERRLMAMGVKDAFSKVLSLEDKILKEHFPGKKEYFDLDDGDRERFIELARQAKPEDALK